MRGHVSSISGTSAAAAGVVVAGKRTHRATHGGCGVDQGCRRRRTAPSMSHSMRNTCSEPMNCEPQRDIDDRAARVPGAGLQHARRRVRAEHRPRLARAGERHREPGALERRTAERAGELDALAPSPPPWRCAARTRRPTRRPPRTTRHRPSSSRSPSSAGTPEPSNSAPTNGASITSPPAEFATYVADAQRARTEIRRRGVRRRSSRHGEGHDRRRPAAGHTVGVADGIRR